MSRPPGRSSRSNTVTQCPRRSGAHHRHPFPGAHLRRPGAHRPRGKPRLDDGQLVVPDRHRVAVQAAGAGRLTQGGAHPPRKLRKAVGLGQAGQGLVQVPGVHQVVPLRHQVVERAPGEHAAQLHSGLAEGHAALHAPRRLPAPFLLGQHEVELVPMPDALRRRLAGPTPAVKFQKSRWLSHYFPPPVTAQNASISASSRPMPRSSHWAMAFRIRS